jgi:hypothetical protein
VDSAIVFEDENIISIVQYVYCSNSEVKVRKCFGNTIDKSTGELIPFTYFTDIDMNEFDESLNSLQSMLITSYEIVYLSQQIAIIRKN